MLEVTLVGGGGGEEAWSTSGQNWIGSCYDSGTLFFHLAAQFVWKLFPFVEVTVHYCNSFFGTYILKRLFVYVLFWPCSVDYNVCMIPTVPWFIDSNSKFFETFLISKRQKYHSTRIPIMSVDTDFHLVQFRTFTAFLNLLKFHDQLLMPHLHHLLMFSPTFSIVRGKFGRGIPTIIERKFYITCFIIIFSALCIELLVVFSKHKQQNSPSLLLDSSETSMFLKNFS